MKANVAVCLPVVILTKCVVCCNLDHILAYNEDCNTHGLYNNLLLFF